MPRRGHLFGGVKSLRGRRDGSKRGSRLPAVEGHTHDKGLRMADLRQVAEPFVLGVLLSWKSYRRCRRASIRDIPDLIVLSSRIFSLLMGGSAPVRQGPPNWLFELGWSEARGRTEAVDMREMAHAEPTPVRGGRRPAGIEGKQSGQALLDPDAAGSPGKHACSPPRLLAHTLSHPLPGGCRFGGLFLAHLGVTQMPR